MLSSKRKCNLSNQSSIHQEAHSHNCRHSSSNGSAASASDPNLAQVLQNWQQSALKSALDGDPATRKALSNIFALDVECVAVGKVSMLAENWV